MIDVSWRTLPLFIPCLCRSPWRTADWLAVSKSISRRSKRTSITPHFWPAISLSVPFLCYRSSCVCKFIDKTTLYTTCVYAGINQRCRHWSWFRKWSWLIFIYSNFTRIVHRDMLFAVAPQSRINCVNCAVDFKSSVKISLFLRCISRKQSKKNISGFFYQWI